MHLQKTKCLHFPAQSTAIAVHFATVSDSFRFLSPEVKFGLTESLQRANWLFSLNSPCFYMLISLHIFDSV